MLKPTERSGNGFSLNLTHLHLDGRGFGPLLQQGRRHSASTREGPAAREQQAIMRWWVARSLGLST